MAFKQGDKVESIVDIKVGMLKPDVRRGRKGVVLSTNFRGNRARVHFDAAGFGNPEVDVSDVDVDYLKRRF